ARFFCAFASLFFPRYNRSTLRRLTFFGPPILFLAVLFFTGGCSVALGPAFLIQKQSLELHFVASPESHLSVHCRYELANSGNQPLQSIQVLVPTAKPFLPRPFVAQSHDKSINAM